MSKKYEAKSRYRLKNDSSRSCDESDPESNDSIQRSGKRNKNSNISISNVTGNLVDDSVVVNIEDDSTTSNEFNSDADIDDFDDNDEVNVAISNVEEEEEDDDVLHHNDWEVRMLAAELKKRESVSELQTATTTTHFNENEGLLRRRKRRSDTDTDVSENETTCSRPRAASLDQYNLRRQQFKSRGVFKAMSFERDKDQL